MVRLYISNTCKYLIVNSNVHTRSTSAYQTNARRLTSAWREHDMHMHKHTGAVVYLKKNNPKS